jgi:hypothetical protein
MVHPDLHCQFLNQLPGYWVFADLGKRHDGSVSRVSRWRRGLDIWEECFSHERIDSVGTNEEVKGVLAAGFRRHCHSFRVFIGDMSNTRVDMNSRPVLFSSLDQAIVEMSSMDYPPPIAESSI